MTQLLAFDIYKTKALIINECSYTLRFARNEDKDEFQILLSNDKSLKQASCRVDKKVANEIEKKSGENLINTIVDIFKNDI